MTNLKYLINRALKMDYKRLFETINNIHEKTGESKIKLFNDFRKCAIKYGAGYLDYDLFEMYNLTPKERNTYITRGRNNDLIRKFNNPEYQHIFLNKNEFNEVFRNYIKRDYLVFKSSSKAEVLNFISKHQIFMAKPLNGTHGNGIEKIDSSLYKKKNDIYNYLAKKDYDILLEELIIQHKELNKIYPGAINTVRFITILDDSNISHIVCTYFRIGNGKYVDNFNNGGMVVPVDEIKGEIISSAIDKNKNLYKTHPSTNTPIKGFKFPNWQDACELVLKASKEIKEIRYVGWDVAFTPSGPLIVEGNEFPGHDIYQLPAHTKNKIGIWPKFAKYYKKNNK